jgi:hypothetical protein
MKVRIVIEYDNDDCNPTLEEERQDWLNGHVDLRDVVECDGKVTFEEVHQ